MKVLMLTPYLPYPPSSGGQVRSFNLIKNLYPNCQITLFSLIKDEKEKQYIPILEKYCQKVMVFKRSPHPWTASNILRTCFSSYPFLVVRNFSKEAKNAIKKELETQKFDLIHAETFYVMPHLPQTQTPIVLVDQTIEFQVYQHYIETLRTFPKNLLKPLLYLDVFKIKHWELYFWKKVDRVIAVSEADKRKMLSLCQNLKVETVPNGAGEDLLSAWKPKKTIPRKPIIFFQANFDWLQNVEAAQNLVFKVFPLIKEKVPDALCLIAGQNALKKMGEIKIKGVKIVDLKNSDINGVIKAYQSASVFLAPLEGPGGTRLKILGAMAVGVPVITTKVGIEGIEAKDGKEVIIANTWQEMAEKTVRLLKDSSFSSKIAQNARKLVEEKYSYQSIAQTLIKIYKDVINEKS